MARGESYKEFVEKFEYKHTTDDCYTPENIYEAVATYVEKTYGKERKNFVRPFWPGGDFEHYDYPKDCVVVDNPPFSIMAKIITFYQKHKVSFFLFASGLTMFNATSEGVCCICTSCDITYENGAQIATSFITNLEENRIRTAPDLTATIKELNSANRVLLRKKKTEQKNWPENLVTSAALGVLNHKGAEFSASKEETTRIRNHDGKPIFGSAYILNEEATKRLNKCREDIVAKEMETHCKIVIQSLGKEKGRQLFEKVCKDLEKLAGGEKVNDLAYR